MIWYFTWTHFFQYGSLQHSSKSNLFTFNICTWGTTLPSYLSTLVLILFMSNHLVLMFLWSPLDLFCVEASSSHRCLEHPSWVIIASMESIPSPFVSCYIPPSFIDLFLSYVTHLVLQSYYPLSLQSRVSSFHVIHALYALTREVVSSLLSTPIPP